MNIRETTANGILVLSLVTWGALHAMITDVSGGSLVYGSCNGLVIEAPSPIEQHIHFMQGDNPFEVGSRAFVAVYLYEDRHPFAPFFDDNLG